MRLNLHSKTKIPMTTLLPRMHGTGNLLSPGSPAVYSAKFPAPVSASHTRDRDTFFDRKPTGKYTLSRARVSELSGDGELARVVREVLDTYAFALEKAPHAFPTLLRAAAVAEQGISVTIVIGDFASEGTQALLVRARKLLGPEDAVVHVTPGAPAPEGLAASWLEGREPQDRKPTAYVCRGTTCSLPITQPAGFEALG